MNAAVGLQTDELRGRIMVSVHKFGFDEDMYHVLVTVLGNIGQERTQSEAEGTTIAQAACLAIEGLFLPGTGSK